MRTPEKAAQAAESTVNNVPGTCQFTVRGWLDAPSAGDYDGDGAADAEDGWKKEPAKARHSDRDGKRGYPAAFLGGSHDMGHRALFVGKGLVRSTDFDGVAKKWRPGHVGTGTVEQVASSLGVTYVGWSETMDGVAIPKPKAPAKPAESRGTQIDEAMGALKKSKRTGEAGKLANQALELLKKIPVIKKK